MTQCYCLNCDIIALKRIFRLVLNKIVCQHNHKFQPCLCEKNASTLLGFVLKHPVSYRLKNWLYDAKENFDEIAEDKIDGKIAKISDGLNEENQIISEDMDDIIIDSWEVLAGFLGYLI